jgi:ribosome maturation factor RimP
MKLETYKAYDKRKRFIGKIDKIEEEEIFFVVDNQTYQINYNDIAKAKIVPTF